jgi:M6 family metalloprotease-like protein
MKTFRVRSFNRPLIFPLLCLAWLLGWPFQMAFAVPATPKLLDFVQPDGTKIQLHLRGDEYFSWHETADGYVVVKDSPDGFWKYARPVAGKVAFRAVAGARVGKADPKRLGLTKRMLPEAKLLRAHVQALQELLDGKTGASTSSKPVAQPPVISAGGVSPKISVSGTKSIKNIVILACFSNHWDSVNGTVYPTNGIVDITAYSNLLNQIGYTNGGAAGSVKDYYREVSYGKLTVDSIVIPWVRLPHDEAYYGNNTNGDTSQMAMDAIAAAAAAGFDFSQGDSDGDGWVDCLDVIHSGYDEAQGGGADAVWSIKGALHSVMTENGVQMYNFHTEPALWGNSGTNLTHIGTICHETGHFFGLPDLYDTAYQTDGLGNWCIMSYGVYNGDGFQPAQMSAWCKAFLGFVKPTTVHSLAGVSVPRAEDNAVSFMVRDGLTNGEYFMIENREKVGFDNTSQIYPGLCIYHIYSPSGDNNSQLRPHPEVRLEEADGNDSLGFSMAAGSQPTDVWSSTNGLAGGLSDQTGNTNTSAMAYLSNPSPYQTNLFYLRTNNAALYSYNLLNHFSAVGSTMTFDATTLKTSPVNQTSPAPNYTVSWAASSQATQYEIQEGTPVTLTSFSDGAESETAMYDNWYVGGKVQRITTNGYAGACSYAIFSSGGAVASLTLQKPFKVTTGTVISFYLMSHIATGNGNIKCDISNDGGNTWKTLGTYNGYIDPWSAKTFNYTAISAVGVSAGDQCLLRFLSDIEYTSGWSSYPAWGFALDQISIAGTEISANGNWTSLSTSVATPSFAITGKANGTNAYRVQAYANGAWQGFGAEGQTIVNLQPVATFASPTNGATFTEPATINLAATVATNNTTVGNVQFFNGATLLATFTTPPYQFAWTSVAPGNYTLTAQVAYNGSSVSTSAPVNVTVNYRPPTLVNDTATTAQNTPVTIHVLANDSDAYGALALTSITQPARGTAAIAGTNVIYTPNNYSYGADSFTYTATNIHGQAATATVSVTTTFPNYASTYTNAVLAVGAVALWRLNETFGTTAYDVLGSHNGANNTGLILGTNGPGAPLFPGFEAANTAYQFPSNTSVSLPVLNLNTNTITIIGWVKIQGSQTSRAGICFDRDNVGGWGLRFGSANNLGFTWNGGFIYDSTLTVPTNQWTFVALVVTPTSGIIYMATNSTLYAWTNSVANVNAGFTNTAYLGWDSGYGTDRHINGAMDEVAIFNRSLTGAQINDLLTAAQTGLPAITLTAPASGGTFNGASNLTLSASVTTNGNHSVEKVQFYTNAVLLAESMSPPYQFNWSSAPSGAYAVTAKLLYDGGSVLTTAAANITVTNSTPAIGLVNGIITPGGSTATLSFAGTPGHSYDIQRATNLLSGFTTLWTTNAPVGGAFNYLDTFSDLGGAPHAAYYRLRWQP